ncbi:methyltransferase domain-containing protein [Kutzneria sp. NPDC051319]|uniref:protein-L-isoaspartate O-methyltransferase family protein n=1 Tax=Kutzneria sp. NPDC051319 TaxID=3155047 RepID=UPI00342DEB18
MPTYSPALARALAAVSEDTFVRRPDGGLIAQSSSQQIIATLIDSLDVQPGMTVLEVGTGSGYSTALLAHLVEGDGRVFSVDVVADLVTRARRILPANGFPQVSVLWADGIHGAPEHGPFDRIIVWATAPHLPAAWITQLALGGVIVAPLALAPISKSGLGARIRLTDTASPTVDRLFPAGFVEMHGQELDQWLIPPYGADVLCRDQDDRAYWLSGTWLRSPEQYLQGQHLLHSLTGDRTEIPGPLQPDESAVDFRAWLLATQPDGLTTAGLGGPAWRIGHTHPTGAALTDALTATHTITSGDADTAQVLGEWAAAWRRAGRPRIADLRPELAGFYDGWVLRAGVR